MRTTRLGTLIFLMALCIGSVPAQGAWDTFSDTWVATDALGRTLPNVAVSGAPRTNRTVALFYYLWNGSHSTGLYDIPKIIAEDPNAIHEFDNPLWGPLHDWHHWGEPLFGYYFMQDEWVIRRHAQMLTDAGVDVVVFDNTNGPNNQYKPVYDKIFNIYQDMLANGQDVPKIAFMTHTDSGLSIRKLYYDIYASSRHSNLWYQWEGKPLILGVLDGLSSSDQNLLNNFFTVRDSWAWDPGEDKWGWLESYPQQGGWSGDPSNLEQVPVSSGSHPHADNGGNGKSYHLNFQPENADRDTELGIQFADQWRRARELDPPVVLVTQWNEWTAQRFQYTGGGISYAKRPLYTNDPWFIDVYDDEFNRDLEPMKGGHGDSFYYQLADNIRRYKGARDPETASAPVTITLSDFSGWDLVTPEFRDDQDDVRHRSHQGFGTNYYTNTSGRNDIRRCKVARDESNIYLFIETVEPITGKASGCEYWMNCFIRDESSDAPDWEGYHFRLSNENPASGKLTLLRSSNGWNWISLGEVDTETNSNQLAVSVPRSLLGLPANSTFAHLTFKWTDNQLDTTADGWLLNGDAAPNARFRYRYWAGGACEEPSAGESYRLIHRTSLEVAVPDGDATTSGLGVETDTNQFGLNQKWTPVQLATGPWVLFNTESVVVNGPGNPLAIGANGAGVENSSYAGEVGQHWVLQSLGGGWVRFVNVATGQALARDSGGALVQTSAPIDFNQYWSFEPVAPVDSGGEYQFSNRASGLQADLEHHSMNPGRDIVQHAATGDWNQDWLAYDQGAGRIQLVSKESRRPLESPDGVAESKITQGSWAADDLQQWEMHMPVTGYFQFSNRGSGHAMGVQSGSTASGAKVVQQSYDGLAMEQQWRLSFSGPVESAFDNLFFDTFDTGNTGDINQEYGLRQADGLVSTNYTYTSGRYSIDENRLKNLGFTGPLTLNANWAPYIVGEDFEISFKLRVLDTTTAWSSIYLTSANEAARSQSRFGLYAPGSGWVFVLYHGIGTQETEAISEAELTTLLGQPYNRAEEHLIQFISTASISGINSYDFLVDGVAVRRGLTYAFSEDTVRQIGMVGILEPETSGGVFYDDLALRTTLPPSYAKWAKDNGLDGVFAERDADPDGDGMNNLVEYALGGNPQLDDAATVLPTYEFHLDWGGYVYTRRRDATDRGLSYDLAYKLDLTDPSWISVGNAWEKGTESIDLSFESVSNEFILTGLDKGFIHLEISEE